LVNGGLDEIWDIGKIKKICAIGATEWGDALMMKGVGFTVEVPATKRIDAHNFNSASYPVFEARAEWYFPKVS